MAITPSDVVERTISALENSTSGDFSNIRGKLYEKARQIEIDLCHGTSGGNVSGIWAAGVDYLKNIAVTKDNKDYRCLEDHTSTPGNAPPNATYWLEEVPLPLPHTLASFVWYLPLCQQTPITQPYTYPVLRPIASGCLIEGFIEMGSAASGGDVLFEFYKNNTKFAEATLPAGQTTVLVPIGGALSDREFTRDDFFAFKITESVTSRARFMTVYLRFFQYPYIMADAQDPLPTPA